MNDKIKINAIKTDVGYYIEGVGQHNYQGTILKNFFFDGKKPETTYHPNWIKIPSIPSKIEKEVSQPNINHRYELIDKTLESVKFPLVFTRERVAEYDDKECYWKWKEQFAHLKSLYAEISDPQPNILVDVPFEFNIIMEMDKIKEYAGFSYPIQRSRWESDGFIPLTDKEVQHQLLDTILFPDIILPAKESHLTSAQTYKIIRKHIQDNINPKYAHITSDYDFCTTVKKKIPLAQKIPYKKDISRYGARKPKYITDYRETREITIFEMTYDEANYKGYTPIEGFKGRNIEELKENIENFLSDLMNKINEPVVDCKCCNGLGVTLAEEK